MKKKIAMKKFEEGITTYHAEESDYKDLEEDEETCDCGILVPDDFS